MVDHRSVGLLGGGKFEVRSPVDPGAAKPKDAVGADERRVHNQIHDNRPGAGSGSGKQDQGKMEKDEQKEWISQRLHLFPARRLYQPAHRYERRRGKQGEEYCSYKRNRNRRNYVKVGPGFTSEKLRDEGARVNDNMTEGKNAPDNGKLAAQRIQNRMWARSFGEHAGEHHERKQRQRDTAPLDDDQQPGPPIYGAVNVVRVQIQAGQEQRQKIKR